MSVRHKPCLLFPSSSLPPSLFLPCQFRSHLEAVGDAVLGLVAVLHLTRCQPPLSIVSWGGGGEERGGWWKTKEQCSGVVPLHSTDRRRKEGRGEHTLYSRVLDGGTSRSECCSNENEHVLNINELQPLHVIEGICSYPHPSVPTSLPIYLSPFLSSVAHSFH